MLSDADSANDYADRLMGVVKREDSYSYQYYGLDNRASQTANGEVTRYTNDQAAGLVQVLANGKLVLWNGNPGIWWNYHITTRTFSTRSITNVPRYVPAVEFSNCQIMSN